MMQIHLYDFALWGWKLVMTKSKNNLGWKGLLDVPWFSPMLKAPSIQAEWALEGGIPTAGPLRNSSLGSKWESGTFSLSQRKQVKELFTFSSLCIVQKRSGIFS